MWLLVTPCITPPESLWEEFNSVFVCVGSILCCDSSDTAAWLLWCQHIVENPFFSFCIYEQYLRKLCASLYSLSALCRNYNIFRKGIIIMTNNHKIIVLLSSGSLYWWSLFILSLCCQCWICTTEEITPPLRADAAVGNLTTALYFLSLDPPNMTGELGQYWESIQATDQRAFKCECTWNCFKHDKHIM